jgi:hypothetical protein
MRLIKMFSLAVLVAVAAMAFVGATPASATFDTQLCKVNEGLLCPAGQAQTHVHWVLVPGTVWKLLAGFNILCLGILVEDEALGLGKPQVIHTTELSFTGCGTGSAHNNCTVTVQEAPLSHLLKTGANTGVLVNLSGRTRLQCANLGLDCVNDLAGMELEASGEILTSNETPTVELGGKLFCPNEGFLDGELETLLETYIKS